MISTFSGVLILAQIVTGQLQCGYGIAPDERTFFDFLPASNGDCISVDFEVFGRVQGVFFRKFTQKQADKLGLSGWCMNTEKGTVQGNLQGSVEKVTEMKKWLSEVGSPQSRIDKALFSQEQTLKMKPATPFAVRR